MKNYFVYILTNKQIGTLYIGVTNDIQRRIAEHKQGKIEGFTKKYFLTKLVYFETHERAYDAISREKQLKGWNRARKINLIEKDNPGWYDLYENYWGLNLDPSTSSGRQQRDITLISDT